MLLQSLPGWGGGGIDLWKHLLLKI